MIFMVLPGCSDELYKLQDDESGLVVTISPEHGGEISSIIVPFEGKMIETLYRGNDFTEIKGWRGRAPLLWPAVGRNYTPAYLDRLKAEGGDPRLGDYSIGEEIFPISIHGFAMNKPWEVVEVKAQSLVCRLKADEETLKSYPFNFTLDVRYSLVGRSISAVYCVRSENDGMFFSIGNHISFNLPLGGRGKYQDTLVKSSATKILELTPYSTLSGVERPRDFSMECSLADETLHDMVTCGTQGDESYIQLINPHLYGASSGTPYGIRVSQREIPAAGVKKSDPADFLLVMWGEPDKGYFCPEPWYGGPNSLNTKKGIITLNAGEEFFWEMSIDFLV